MDNFEEECNIKFDLIKDRKSEKIRHAQKKYHCSRAHLEKHDPQFPPSPYSQGNTEKGRKPS